MLAEGGSGPRGVERVGHVSRSMHRWSPTARALTRIVAQPIPGAVDESLLYP